MNDILEVEFQLAYNMKVQPNFDEKEFFELIWLYERMAEQRRKENEEAQKKPGDVSLSDVMNQG